MKTMDKALLRMGELAMLAKDNTKSQADLNLYQKEFQQLQDYVDNTRTKEFNAVSMFGATTINVTVDSEGNTFKMPPINLGAGTTAGAYSAAVTTGIDLTTSANAGDALTAVKAAISQIAIDRAQLGAVQSRLNFTNDQLNITKENLSSAISRVADVDVATEATNYARYQILVQSGTQMLTQANNLPNAALQLLRG